MTTTQNTKGTTIAHVTMVTPSSWSMTDTFQVAREAADLIRSDEEKIDERVRTHARGAADARRLLRIYDRAEKVAAAWRGGKRFDLVAQYL